jgi:hypothetical protein
MSVTLLRPYGGFQAGQVATFSAELEAALVAQGLATSGGTPTTGNQTTTQSQSPALPVSSGFAYIGAGASSVTVSNPNITANSKVFASIQQAAADTTLTVIETVNAASGVATIVGDAAATATVKIAYVIFN